MARIDADVAAGRFPTFAGRFSRANADSLQPLAKVLRASHRGSHVRLEVVLPETPKDLTQDVITMTALVIAAVQKQLAEERH